MIHAGPGRRPRKQTSLIINGVLIFGADDIKRHAGPCLGHATSMYTCSGKLAAGYDFDVLADVEGREILPIQSKRVLRAWIGLQSCVTIGWVLLWPGLGGRTRMN
jgi:hypothetical protein